MTVRAMLGFASAVFIGLASAVSMAGESGTLSGDGGGGGSAPSIKLGNGDTIMLLASKQIVSEKTPDGLVYYPGECVGVAVVKADGTYIGGEGDCAWHQSETDTWDVHFIETGPEGGTFEITGGSGKWKGVTATGGTYTYVYNDGEKWRYTYKIDYTIP